MLKTDDFDFYYLIICSRGPGSETIVVDNVSDRRDAIHFYEGSEDQFKKIGACGAEADFNDEGPIIAVPKGTKPLKAIYELIKFDNERWEADLTTPLGDDPESLKRMEDLRKEFEENNQAYLSACIRAFLPSNLKPDDNPWTSCNAWRKLEIEIPNKSQFEALMEATGETAGQLEQWNCKVMKEAARLYLEGNLPEREFPGC